MRCAMGIFAKGIWGGTGFSLLRWEKGSATPFWGGKKGLRLPRSLGRSMRNEGVSDPFSHLKRESQTLFPTAKGKPRTSQNPLTILFKIITRIKLVFSNYLGRYSYSFRARQEFISVTVTVLWVRREYVFTVRYSYIKNGPWNYFPIIAVTVT